MEKTTSPTIDGAVIDAAVDKTPPTTACKQPFVAPSLPGSNRRWPPTVR